MLTHSECQIAFKPAARGQNAGACKLANNTFLIRLDNGDYAVRLHKTNVVTIHRDGTYTLNSGGWQTVTTKDRIRRYSPAKLYQRLRVWSLGQPYGDSVAFRDGIRIDATGKVVS